VAALYPLLLHCLNHLAGVGSLVLVALNEGLKGLQRGVKEAGKGNWATVVCAQLMVVADGLAIG